MKEDVLFQQVLQWYRMDVRAYSEQFKVLLQAHVFPERMWILDTDHFRYKLCRLYMSENVETEAYDSSEHLYGRNTHPQSIKSMTMTY